VRLVATRLLGFTLIEFMVTLVVAAILLTVAVPSFVDFLDRNRVRGAADDVVSLISDARAEAVKADRDVNIAMSGSGNSWCIGANAATPPAGGNPAGTATSCDCSDTAACRVAGQRMAIETGAFPDVQAGALTAFTFNSKLGALVPLGDRSFSLTSPRGKYALSVEVNALGQARLCVPANQPEMSGVAPC